VKTILQQELEAAGLWDAAAEMFRKVDAISAKEPDWYRKTSQVWERHSPELAAEIGRVYLQHPELCKQIDDIRSKILQQT
jgi:hypothetical protein